MSDTTAGILKVKGSNIAMVVTGPRPGSTPTRVPSVAPIQQYKMLLGVSATPKPTLKLCRMSVICRAYQPVGKRLKGRPSA